MRSPDERDRARAVRRRLNRQSRTARRHAGLAAALGIAEVALVVAQATLLAHVIARTFMDGATLAELTPELLWLAGIALGRGLVSAAFETSGRLGAAKVMAELRDRLTHYVLFERPGGVASERRGELAAASVQGVDALEAYFARYMPQVAIAAIAPFAILLWTFPRDAESTAILAVTFPLIPVFMILIGKLAERRTRQRWHALSKLSSRFFDVVSGLETLRAHGRTAGAAGVVEAAGERYRKETMGTLRVGFLSALVLELLAMLGTALVAAAIGIQLAAGDLGLEAGLTVLFLAPELYLPLRQLGAQFHASADGLAAAERIFEITDTPAAVERAEHPQPCPDPARSAIEFREAGFTYPGRPTGVLRGVSFTIGPGESVALTGPSGCGKTTLASLLLRLADPDEGGVRCGGVDLRSVDVREWRSQLAWIPQRPTIFPGTVLDNVRLGDRDAGVERVHAALQKARAAEFVDALPDGIETLIGDGGRRLSAGESQRIALARAFLVDPSLLILDEPTAHLDAESEREIALATRELIRDRTALIIAHRNPLAEIADRVVELRDGSVVPAEPSLAGIA